MNIELPLAEWERAAEKKAADERRELLLRAAMMAGLVVVRPAEPSDRGSGLLVDCDGLAPSVWWNPLENDGEALRLAVALCLEVSIYPGDVAVTLPNSMDAVWQKLSGCRDRCECARLAIVRAAARLAGNVITQASDAAVDGRPPQAPRPDEVAE